MSREGQIIKKKEEVVLRWLVSAETGYKNYFSESLKEQHEGDDNLILLIINKITANLLICPIKGNQSYLLYQLISSSFAVKRGNKEAQRIHNLIPTILSRRFDSKIKKEIKRLLPSLEKFDTKNVELSFLSLSFFLSLSHPLSLSFFFCSALLLIFFSDSFSSIFFSLSLTSFGYSNFSPRGTYGQATTLDITP